MADNFLEYHREDYERRKALWLAKKKKSLGKKSCQRALCIDRPEDEAL